MRAVAETLYAAGEAARILGVSLDTLRRWGRQGRIRVERDSANRRVVRASEIARIRGSEKHNVSARNRFRGLVTDVKVEGLLAQVEIVADAPVRVVSVITREAAEELGLAVGAPVTAFVKATSVMVER
jgi:molybdopterin-binding protein